MIFKNPFAISPEKKLEKILKEVRKKAWETLIYDSQEVEMNLMNTLPENNIVRQHLEKIRSNSQADRFRV